MVHLWDARGLVVEWIRGAERSAISHLIQADAWSYTSTFSGKMAAFDWMSIEMKEALEILFAIVLALGLGIPMVMLPCQRHALPCQHLREGCHTHLFLNIMTH